MTTRVQHAHGHGGEADEKQIRKHPAQQLKHQRGFLVPLAPFQGGGDAQQPHAYHAGQYHDQAAHQGIGRAPHGLFADGFFLFLENRNERRHKGALAQQATEEVGDHEGQHERPGHQPSPMKRA